MWFSSRVACSLLSIASCSKETKQTETCQVSQKLCRKENGISYYTYLNLWNCVNDTEFYSVSLFTAFPVSGSNQYQNLLSHPAPDFTAKC